MSPPQETGRRVVIQGFDRFGGLHCETCTLQKVLAFQGVVSSEETLLGLGGGIGFIYWQSKGMKNPFVGGRNGGIPAFVETLTHRLRQPFEISTTSSPRKAYERLLARLEEGLPVVCYGDMFHLSYLETRGHFGGHSFVVYGVDEGEGVALVSDRSVRPQRLSLDELERARSSPSPPFPPQNRMIELRAEPGRWAGREDFLAAVSSCVTAMTQPPISNLGLRGFEKLGRNLARGIADLPPKDLVELLTSLFINLEVAGTGGCAFRKMYRRFLAENAGILDHPAVAEAIGLLDAAIEAWERLIATLLPEEVPQLGAIQESFRDRGRILEGGEPTAAKDFDSLVGPAVKAVGRDRRPLNVLPELVEEVRSREERFFDVLRQVAPPEGGPKKGTGRKPKARGGPVSTAERRSEKP